MNVVSLVGRPNTGKSALFNRIAKKRVAIVFDQPGVTRDRVTREVDMLGRRVMLVDTGGIAFDKSVTHDPLDEETRAQAALAVEDSAVCVIVVDAREGVTPLDAEVIKRVRESGVACVIAANKCDTADDDWRAAEFERFGLRVYPTSAEHGRGVETLVSDVVAKLPPAEESETAKRPLRVAVVGRPNAGKSSYINRLLNAPRVIVSEIAGTTRDAVEVPFAIGSGPEARHYMLVDTAGMKPHTKMSKTSVDNFSLFRSEQAIEEADVVVLLLDPMLGPTMQDKRIAGKILEANRACVILVNKWDLATEADGDMTEAKALPALRAMMPFLNFAPVVFCSNKSGYNIRRTVDAIDKAAASASERLPTGMLNRVLTTATKKTLSPMVRGKRLKVYYGLQVSTNPQTIRLFVNDPKLVTPAYLSYLEKNIRARFGLEGAPMRIFLKARSRNEGGLKKKEGTTGNGTEA